MKKCGTRRPHFFIETAKSGVAFRLEKIEKTYIKGKLNPILHNVRKHSSYP